MLGPQGAGKGTQAKRISAEYDLAHISTGERFRREIASGTEFGLRIEPILGAGELVPDELTIGRLRQWVDEGAAVHGFVLDGFPRNLTQAQALDAMLAGLGRSLDAILFLDLPDAEAIARIRGRAAAEGRADDTPDALRRRLEHYHHDTEPVVEYYRATGKLVPVHAERPVDAVYAEIQSALEHLGARVA
jgi:adenylate kinase